MNRIRFIYRNHEQNKICLIQNEVLKWGKREKLKNQN